MGNAAEASQGEEQRKSGHDVEVSWVVADDVRRLVQEFPVSRSQSPVLETGNWRLGTFSRPSLVTSAATGSGYGPKQ
jgi:hypothetical protein